MFSADSTGSGAFSPVLSIALTVAALAGFDLVNTGLIAAADAKVPLTFKKVRRFTDGLNHLVLFTLAIVLFLRSIFPA